MESFMINSFELKNISFSHKEQKIINRLNLSHKHGDIALWVGPSGGGKSSLAKIICSHLKATAGELKIFGQNVQKAGLDRLYVGHENDLFQWQTFEKHIQFLFAHRYSKKFATEDEIRQYAQMLEIQTLLKKYPSQISMGEARRFQILRALLLKSEIVIFDETFSALDAQLKQRIMPRLNEIWKKNKTSVVIISHESDKNHILVFNQILDFSTFSKDK